MLTSREISENFADSTADKYYQPSKRRGKHKIFIGMAPGVGKTYRMLEEGAKLREGGIDVVIGLLETHGRQETIEKAIGFETVPLLESTYSGVTLKEMNTEAILDRRPQLVLVDELAHTNVPGSPREKRYQDVEIILTAGIDVYSTVNIQHLESLNDLVAKITSIVVRERIPDRILEGATEVVVIDVTPETLQERLKEGKIYTSEKIEKSLENFFQRRHLVALRELALREVADNIEAGADSGTHGHVCSVHERVLVCVSTYPNSLQLLRRGARAATQLHARFYAVFVSNPERFLNKQESLHVEMCEDFCKQMGGEFIRVEGYDVTKAIAEVAQANRITQIVLGQTQKSRWQLLFKSSPIQELMKYLKDVDLHIIADERNK